MKRMMQQQGMVQSDGKVDYNILRATIDKAAENMPVEPVAAFTPDTLNGVDVEMVTPFHLNGDEIIFYIHDGGFAT